MFEIYEQTDSTVYYRGENINYNVSLIDDRGNDLIQDKREKGERS